MSAPEVAPVRKRISRRDTHHPQDPHPRPAAGLAHAWGNLFTYLTTFRGRASPSEAWGVGALVLLCLPALLVLQFFLDRLTAGYRYHGQTVSLIGLGLILIYCGIQILVHVLLPALLASLTARRLRDIGFSPQLAWLLLAAPLGLLLQWLGFWTTGTLLPVIPILALMGLTLLPSAPVTTDMTPGGSPAANPHQLAANHPVNGSHTVKPLVSQHPTDGLPRPRVGGGIALSNLFSYMTLYKGKASRSEYWWVFAFWAATTALVCAAIFLFMLWIAPETGQPGDKMHGFGEVMMGLAGIILAWVAFMLSYIIGISLSLGLQLRRLRDAGFSPWWALCFVGILLDVLMLPVTSMMGIGPILGFWWLGFIPLLLCLTPSRDRSGHPSQQSPLPAQPATAYYQQAQNTYQR